MKLVPIKDLKMNLAFWIKHVAKGEAVVITKHNNPIAFLSPAHDPSLHRGKNVGKAALKSIGTNINLKTILKTLDEDRAE